MVIRRTDKIFSEGVSQRVNSILVRSNRVQNLFTMVDVLKCEDAVCCPKNDSVSVGRYSKCNLPECDPGGLSTLYSITSVVD